MLVGDKFIGVFKFDFLLLQFLQDILDTLFVILDDNTEKYGLLVFQSLVSLILPDFKLF